MGAPFDANGSVFIYFGGKLGLRIWPSQHLTSPLPTASNGYGSHMFGHGLAKGYDIDKNGYNDLAVGAPNAEAVLLYRAYPVVKIHASINSTFKQISMEQKTFDASICYAIETVGRGLRNQDIELRAVLDGQHKRVQFSHSASNEMKLSVAAGPSIICKTWKCNVEYKARYVFRPIKLELHYNIVKGMPESEGI